MRMHRVAMAQVVRVGGVSVGRTGGRVRLVGTRGGMPLKNGSQKMGSLNNGSSSRASVRVRAVQAGLVSSSLSSSMGSAPGNITELFSLSEGLELPVQVIYLSTLLGFLVVGAVVVTREVLSKRGMDEMAKGIGERVREGGARGEEEGVAAGETIGGGWVYWRYNDRI